jgi:hypothetical protein
VHLKFRAERSLIEGVWATSAQLESMRWRLNPGIRCDWRWITSPFCGALTLSSTVPANISESRQRSTSTNSPKQSDQTRRHNTGPRHPTNQRNSASGTPLAQRGLVDIAAVEPLQLSCYIARRRQLLACPHPLDRFNDLVDSEISAHKS